MKLILTFTEIMPVLCAERVIRKGLILHGYRSKLYYVLNTEMSLQTGDVKTNRRGPDYILGALRLKITFRNRVFGLNSRYK